MISLILQGTAQLVDILQFKHISTIIENYTALFKVTTRQLLFTSPASIEVLVKNPMRFSFTALFLQTDLPLYLAAGQPALDFLITNLLR